MSLVDTLSNTVTITVIVSIIGVIAAFGTSLWKTINESRKEKPILEQGQKAIEERQKKLGLNGKIMPLYVDTEQLTSFYAQTKREKTSLQIDSVTKSRSFEASAKLDTKIASAEEKANLGELTVFSEYKNVEHMLVTVLESLYDKGQLITDLEKPNETDDLLNVETYTLIPGKKHEPLPADIKEAINKLRTWRKALMLEKMEQLVDKIILIKGLFTTNSCSENLLVINFQNKGLSFEVRGLCSNDTKIGETTFKPDLQMNISVFGYVSAIEKKEHSVVITPVTICRLLS